MSQAQQQLNAPEEVEKSRSDLAFADEEKAHLAKTIEDQKNFICIMKDDLKDTDSKIGGLETENQVLKGEISSAQTEISALKLYQNETLKAKETLEMEKDELMALAEVGKTIRGRFMHISRRDMVEGSPIYVYLGVESDKDVIDRGNVAAHHGNWLADKAWACQGALSQVDKEHFGRLYEANPESSFTLRRNIEWREMNATMVSCLAWTKRTHSQANDTAFNTEKNAVKLIIGGLINKHPQDMNVIAEELENNLVIKGHFAKMHRIVSSTVRAHKEYIRN